MARLTDDGWPKRPPPGLAGLHISWQDLSAWLSGELHDQRKRLILVRNGNPGGDGGHHGAAWKAGYAVGAHNALHEVKRSLGVATSGNLKPAPARGTPERNGYDAAITTATVLIGAIHAS